MAFWMVIYLGGGIPPRNISQSFGSENKARNFQREKASMGTIRWVSSKIVRAVTFWGRDPDDWWMQNYLLTNIVSGDLQCPDYQGTRYPNLEDNLDDPDEFTNDDYLP